MSIRTGEKVTSCDRELGSSFHHEEPQWISMIYLVRGVIICSATADQIMLSSLLNFLFWAPNFPIKIIFEISKRKVSKSSFHYKISCSAHIHLIFDMCHRENFTLNQKFLALISLIPQCMWYSQPQFHLLNCFLPMHLYSDIISDYLSYAFTSNVLVQSF